jgi:hypothetical protein
LRTRCIVRRGFGTLRYASKGKLAFRRIAEFGNRWLRVVDEVNDGFLIVAAFFYRRKK